MAQATLTLRFRGRFDPDAITSLLDLRPTRAHRANQVLRPGKVAKEGYWGYRLAEEDPLLGSDVSTLLAIGVDFIEARVRAIAAACSLPGTTGTLGLALYIPPGGFIPGIVLTSPTTLLLGKVGLTFEVDGMLLAPDQTPDVDG